MEVAGKRPPRGERVEDPDDLSGCRHHNGWGEVQDTGHEYGEFGHLFVAFICWTAWFTLPAKSMTDTHLEWVLHQDRW